MSIFYKNFIYYKFIYLGQIRQNLTPPENGHMVANWPPKHLRRSPVTFFWAIWFFFFFWARQPTQDPLFPIKKKKDLNFDFFFHNYASKMLRPYPSYIPTSYIWAARHAHLLKTNATRAKMPLFTPYLSDGKIKKKYIYTSNDSYRKEIVSVKIKMIK